MNYFNTLNLGSKILKQQLIKSHSLDSEILLAEALNLNRDDLLFNLDKKISIKNFKKFNNLIKKRKKRIPVAYLIGSKEFWKTKFSVNNSVLIPRPETEIIVEESLKLLEKNVNSRILDVGSGSGCIILSILKERNNCSGIGIDISKKAIKTAKLNAKIQQLNNRARFIQIDIDKFFLGKYDLVVSNPPYIKNLKIKSLDEDVKDFEPKIAIDGGIDGFNLIKKVIIRSSKLIKKNGKFVIEIGMDQGITTCRLLKANGFYVNKVIKDLSGKQRCILATKI